MSYKAVMDAQKAQILAILAGAQEDLAAKQILRHMPPDVCVERMQNLLAWMTADKAVHIARTYGKTRFYRIGAESGLPAPTPAERILFALSELGPQTGQQLHEATGLSRTYICDIINRELRPEGGPKQVYIRKFIKKGNARTLLYAIGSQPDAVRPKPLSQAENERRRQIRLRADADKMEQFRMKARLRKVKPKADPFLSQFAGLFGQRMAA